MTNKRLYSVLVLILLVTVLVKVGSHKLDVKAYNGAISKISYNIQCNNETQATNIDDDGYNYSMLSTSEKIVYLEIRNAIRDFTKNIKVSTTNKEELSKIYECVLNDHPEFFYHKLDLTLIKRVENEKIVDLYIQFEWLYSNEELKNRQYIIDSIISNFMSNIRYGATEFKKVKFAYECIAKFIDYGGKLKDGQTINSVFINRKSVCAGYARALQYMLNKMKIQSTVVYGTIGNMPHAWNMVNINGKWTYVDVTMGDTSSISPDYSYLGMSTEELLRTHKIDYMVPLPICYSIKQ